MLPARGTGWVLSRLPQELSGGAVFGVLGACKGPQSAPEHAGRLGATPEHCGCPQERSGGDFGRDGEDGVSVG